MIGLDAGARCARRGSTGWSSSTAGPSSIRIPRAASIRGSPCCATAAPRPICTRSRSSCIRRTGSPRTMRDLRRGGGASAGAFPGADIDRAAHRRGAALCARSGSPDDRCADAGDRAARRHARADRCVRATWRATAPEAQLHRRWTGAATPATSPIPTPSTALVLDFLEELDHASRRLRPHQQQWLADQRERAAVHAELRSQQADRAERPRSTGSISCCR